MANIKVTIDYPIANGLPLTFKSPADCSQVTGIKVQYPSGTGTTSNKTFQFADAHGNNVGSIDLFASNVLVKVILDVDASKAYVQNADTNAYLEAQLAGKAPIGYAPKDVTVTDTTPTKATKYYPLYAADKSGKQTVSANKDLYYYDTGTASYFNVGDTDQKGGLTLHASNGKYVNVVASDAPTENRDITLPDVSGTVYTTGNKPTAADVGATPYVRGTAKLTAHGWYRLFTFHGQATNNMALVMFGNTYYGSQLHPQGVSAIVNLNGYTTSSIVILSGAAKKVFSKMRVVKAGSNMALEAYYCGTNNDTVYGTAFGLGSTSTFTAIANNFAPSTVTNEQEEVKVTQDIAIIPSGNVLTDHRTFMYRKLLTASDNLDNFLEDGVFVYNTGDAPSNAPFPNASVGICFGSDSEINQRVQIVMRYGAQGYMRFRGYTGNSWTDWADVYTSAVKPTAEDVGAVNKAGDKMSGGLEIETSGTPRIVLNATAKNRMGEIECSTLGTYLANAKDLTWSDYAALIIRPETVDLAAAMQYRRVIAGETDTYNILHTGNLDANQIGRMVSGTYTGDGNYGSTKPSQLTIGFAPKLLVVLRSGLRYSGEIGGFIWSADSGSISFGGNTLDSITTDGTTVTWYASSEYIQSNERGVVYSYIAFG